jgi:hypothetical protein
VDAFSAQLAQAFVYPFKGHGIILITGGVGLLYPLILLTREVWVTWGLVLLLLGYFWNYYLYVIYRSASGEDELPDWPEVIGFWSTFIRPIFYVLAHSFVSFMPAYYGAWAFEDHIGTQKLLGTYISATSVFYCLIVMGLLYFPMGLLTIAMVDSLAALNPFLIIRSIARIPFRYLQACGLFFIVFFINYSLRDRTMEIPVVGIVLQMLVSMYLMLVAMRILGLVYRANAEKLAWS